MRAFVTGKAHLWWGSLPARILLGFIIIEVLSVLIGGGIVWVLSFFSPVLLSWWVVLLVQTLASVVLILSLGLWMLAYWLWRPLKRLLQTSDAMWQGDANVRLPVEDMPGELGLLANSQNRSAAQLRALVTGLEMQVTELSQAQGALRESEERFRVIVDSMNDAVFVLDAHSGRVVDVNVKAVEMYGYAREKFYGLKPDQVSEGKPPYTHRELLRLIRRSAGSPQMVEWRARRFDGSLFWVELNIRRIHLNEVDRAVVVARDITERKQSEQLRAALYRIAYAAQGSENLETFFAFIHGIVGELMPASDFYIALYDPDTNIVSYPYFVDSFEDVPEPHLLNEGLTAYVLRTGQVVLATPEYALSLWELGEAKTVGPSSVDWLGAPLRTPRGMLGVIAVQTYDTNRRLREQDKEVLAFIATQVATAIERKWAEEQIQISKEELERRVEERTIELRAANAELEAFSYSVSHDLRAPLRALDGYSRMLLDLGLDEFSPEAARFAQIIRESARQMGLLIEDLLELSRLNRQPLTRETVNQKVLIDEVRELLQETHNPQIVIGNLPICRADRSLLKQVWVNLIFNAAKFTRHVESPRIEIDSTRLDDETIYFVRDNGVGFSMEYASKLFGVFQRLHRADEFEGTGVGLAIVQRIIRRHGGRIWAESQPGKGATFFFTLGAEDGGTA